jgi:glycosyltransferase involved in cell wall biosynthesis
LKVALIANTDWYLYNFRLPLARALRERGDDVFLLSPPGRYAELLKQEGFQWEAFSLERKGTNPLTELLTIRRLTQVYRRIQPDVVHHFTIKPVLYGSLAARLAGVPHILNAVTGLGHAFIGKNVLLRLVVLLLYRLSLGGTFLVFQNSDDRELFLANKLARSAQTCIIPGSGVDTRRFKPQPQPDRVEIIVLPGRLLKSKGVQEFAAAAKQIRTKHPEIRFSLCGEPDEGNPETISPAELQAWQEAGTVEWWGWRDDMENVYRQAGIVCLPSYREGLSRTLLEAAASARPIIASDVPGCREVVRHGQNGLLVPVRDPLGLAEALQTLIDNPKLRAEMGQRGREIVEREYSIETIIAQTLRVYEELDA